MMISVPVLLMAGAALYRANLEERQARDAIQRAWEVRSLVQDSLVLVSNAEASVREFALRGDGSLPEPHLPPPSLLPPLFLRLNSLPPSTPLQLHPRHAPDN